MMKCDLCGGIDDVGTADGWWPSIPDWVPYHYLCLDCFPEVVDLVGRWLSTERLMRKRTNEKVSKRVDQDKKQ